MSADATETLRQIEERVGKPLPEDYRELITSSGAIAEMHEGAYFDLWSPDRVLSAMTDEAFDWYRERYPGLLVIGTDGASEMIGYDLRRMPPPVVLVNSVSAGWHEACFQDATITALLANLRSGGSFKFDGGYS